MNAFEAGVLAFSEGLLLTENPFQCGTVEYNDWVAGYNDALDTMTDIVSGEIGFGI